MEGDAPKRFLGLHRAVATHGFCRRRPPGCNQLGLRRRRWRGRRRLRAIDPTDAFVERRIGCRCGRRAGLAAARRGPARRRGCHIAWRDGRARGIRCSRVSLSHRLERHGGRVQQDGVVAEQPTAAPAELEQQIEEGFACRALAAYPYKWWCGLDHLKIEIGHIAGEFQTGRLVGGDRGRTDHQGAQLLGRHRHQRNARVQGLVEHGPHFDLADGKRIRAVDDAGTRKRENNCGETHDPVDSPLALPPSVDVPPA